MRSSRDSKYDIVAFVAWSNSIQCLCLCSYLYIIEGKVSSFSIALGMALASQPFAAFSLFPEGLVWLILSFIQYQFILKYVRGTQEYRCSKSPEEEIGFPGSGATGIGNQPSVAAGNQTRVLHQSIICSLPLSHLSSPRSYFY